MSLKPSPSLCRLPLIELKLVKNSAEARPMGEIGRGEFITMNTEYNGINFDKLG
jgi:hypothetical protein